jgi:hypothetical protein
MDEQSAFSDAYPATFLNSTALENSGCSRSGMQELKSQNALARTAAAQRCNSHSESSEWLLPKPNVRDG